ncbi:MAG: hypothetical protein J6F30_02980 [Cellulosilyticum sp.]|nr:hypothetical protein [Cellulosilyticum sp.]
MPKVDKADLEGAIYTREIVQIINKGIDEYYYDIPNNGTVEKVDFEQLVKEYFPMIDISKLVGNIYGEYLNIGLENVEFQCSSDDCDYSIACGAYAIIQSDNSFGEWHNF